MTLNQTLTELAAERLLSIRDNELPDEVLKQAVTCVLDYLGALCSGLSTPWASALLAYAQKQPSPSVDDGERAAHVIGLAKAVSAEAAAFTNAAIAHSVIRDDMHLGAGAHIGVMVIPAALALAEREGWTSADLLKGIVGGYEMSAALGVALRSSGQKLNQHFRPSGIVGAFGAASVGVAAGMADDCTTGSAKSVAASALGLAANMAGGLNEWAWAGGMEINTQMGTASRGGIISLDLAKAGIQSSSTVLEGEDGVFAAYGCTVADAADNFRRWLEESSLGAGILGTKFKPFAGCNFIQTPLAVASRLSERLTGIGGSTEDIESISIVTTTAARDYPGCNNNGPLKKVQQSKMSLQYGVSAALLFRGCIDEFAFCQYDDAKLNGLIQKCTIETSREYDSALLLQGRQPCRVVAQFKDGTVHQDYSEDVPWLQAMAVEDRFKYEAGELFDQQIVDKVAGICWALQSDGRSCTELFAMLAAPQKLHQGVL